MVEEKKKYILVTRSDMDGLVCAVLLKQLDMIKDIKFVHPKDVQDGKIELTDDHITTNLPYNQAVHMAFDHHFSEIERVGGSHSNQVIDPHAPSAARVVYDYFGAKKTFPTIPDDLMFAVDKADSAQYTLEDVLLPKGWELLSFLMDARTGLGRFKDFRISNYALMMDLIDHCVEYPIAKILELPDVKERVDLYFHYHEDFKNQIKRCTQVYKRLAVLDLRDEEPIYPGNRFMIYALFPDANISMHVLWGLKKQNTVFAVGKSIFDRNSKVKVGPLMLEYGGGGHEAVGTCQVPNEKSEEVKKELIERIISII